MKENTPEQYHFIYAQRHHGELLCGTRIEDAYGVRDNDKLSLAARIEYCLGRKLCDVGEARREFLETYPNHNFIVSGRTQIDIAGRVRYTLNPTSILEIIRPYPDSIHRIKSLSEAESKNS